MRDTRRTIMKRFFNESVELLRTRNFIHESSREKFNQVCFKISELVTRKYSTSFYTASLLYNKKVRKHIFSIYGFVRFADEIVDSFHSYDKEKLLSDFERDCIEAIQIGISLNPILHSFQETMRKFNIPYDYVDAFLNSMRLDLNKTTYSSKAEIKDYIYGSAEVVGLMCLKVFCEKNEKLFNELKDYAIKLGSAFQKVNFLRDIKNDTKNLGRIYFPELVNKKFDEETKRIIIEDIENDFAEALKGIKRLPYNSKLAVYIAYLYYMDLLKKIQKSPAEEILSRRIRVNDFKKLILILRAIIDYKLKRI